MLAHHAALAAPRRDASPPPPPPPPPPPDPKVEARRRIDARMDKLCAAMAAGVRAGTRVDARTLSPPKLCFEFSEKGQAECERHFVGPRAANWDARPCVWDPWLILWPEDAELVAARGKENRCQVLPQGSCGGGDAAAAAGLTWKAPPSQQPRPKKGRVVKDPATGRIRSVPIRLRTLKMDADPTPRRPKPATPWWRRLIGR